MKICRISPIGLILLNAVTALGQSSQDTLGVELAAVRTIIATIPNTNGRPRYILDSAIVKREAAPGYEIGARSTARARRLAEALGVPYMGRDEAVVCDTNRSCEIRNAPAFVRLSEVLFVRDTASVTATIDRQGPDHTVNGVRRRRMNYETIHYVFVRDGSGWKLIGGAQLGIS